MKVAVAYAAPKKQLVIDLEVEEGTTAEQAVLKSGILKKFSELDLSQHKLGVFGKIVPSSHVLSAGERVEIYRPAIGKPPKKGAAAKAMEEETEEEG
ncbi:MAG: RnfH family protein [Magnetococcus sp. MYC-9]